MVTCPHGIAIGLQCVDYMCHQTMNTGIQRVVGYTSLDPQRKFTVCGWLHIPNPQRKFTVCGYVSQAIATLYQTDPPAKWSQYH